MVGRGVFLFIFCSAGDGCNRVARSPAPTRRYRRVASSRVASPSFPGERPPVGSFNLSFLSVSGHERRASDGCSRVARSPALRGATGAVACSRASVVHSAWGAARSAIGADGLRSVDRSVGRSRFSAGFVPPIRRQTEAVARRAATGCGARRFAPSRAERVGCSVRKGVSCALLSSAHARALVCRLALFPSVGPTWRRRVSVRARGGANRRRVAKCRQSVDRDRERVGSVGVGGLPPAEGSGGESLGRVRG